MPMPLSMHSHDKKSNDVPHIDCLNLRNTMVPLMMPLASCYTDAHGIIWPKNSCCISFQLSWPMEFSGAIVVMWCQCLGQLYYMTKTVMVHLILIILTWGIELYHWQCHQHHKMPMPVPVVSHDQKKSYGTSWWSSWPQECDGVIDVVSNMWCWCPKWWHHMTKGVMLHLILIVLI